MRVTSATAGLAESVTALTSLLVFLHASSSRGNGPTGDGKRSSLPLRIAGLGRRRGGCAAVRTTLPAITPPTRGQRGARVSARLACGTSRPLTGLGGFLPWVLPVLGAPRR